MNIRINGVKHYLNYRGESGSRGHEYLTEGNRSCPSFPFKLENKIGKTFRMSGNLYHVIGRRKDDK